MFMKMLYEIDCYNCKTMSGCAFRHYMNWQTTDCFNIYDFVMYRFTTMYIYSRRPHHIQGSKLCTLYKLNLLPDFGIITSYNKINFWRTSIPLYNAYRVTEMGYLRSPVRKHLGRCLRFCLESLGYAELLIAKQCECVIF